MRGKRATNMRVDKNRLIKALKDAEMGVMAGLKTYEEQLEDWKQNAPARFAKFVENYNPDNSWWSDGDFRPPKKLAVCQDWRVQGLNRCIARITTMTGTEKTPDIINVSSNDDVWNYVGTDACM